MNKKRSVDLIHGPILPSLLSFAFPILLSNIFQQLYNTADVKNKDLKVSASDKYLVLSTCREEDATIRANLYLRQIPDSEMSDFLAKHGSELTYTPTR